MFCRLSCDILEFLLSAVLITVFYERKGPFYNLLFHLLLQIIFLLTLVSYNFLFVFFFGQNKFGLFFGFFLDC